MFGKIGKKPKEEILCDITASNDDCLEGKRISKDISVTSSDEHEGIFTLGDDITCLDDPDPDHDPSHSSRVGGNEAAVISKKVAPTIVTCVFPIVAGIVFWRVCKLMSNY